MTNPIFHFFGDSICFGQFVSPHRTWVAQVAQKLEAEGELPFNVNNVSHSGDTTRMGLARMDYDVLAHGVHTLWIQFGMNDCNYWQTHNGLPRVSQKSFVSNLEEIIDRGRAHGAKTLYLATNHPTPKTTPFPYASCSYQESNRHYNTLIRSVAKEKKVILVDNEASWLAHFEKHSLQAEALLLEDQIHLNQAGHDLYFQTAWSSITGTSIRHW